MKAFEVTFGGLDRCAVFAAENRVDAIKRVDAFVLMCRHVFGTPKTEFGGVVISEIDMGRATPGMREDARLVIADAKKGAASERQRDRAIDALIPLVGSRHRSVAERSLNVFEVAWGGALPAHVVEALPIAAEKVTRARAAA